MRRCAFCQGELDPATRICRACGRVQPPADDDITLVPPLKAKGAGALTRRCPHCNALLPAAARFCGHCGQALPSLAGETPAKLLHDTGKPPEGAARDEAITNVLKPPARLADMPADAPKVTLAAGSVPRRHDMDPRQGPGGVAHGLRFRMLSRMQARIVVTALVALLVIGGAAGVQSGLFTQRANVAQVTATRPVVIVSATTIPTSIAPTPTSELATPTPTPTLAPGGGFRVTPTTFTQTCAGTATLAPLSVTADNSVATASVTWQVMISDTDPQGHVWATASPTGGTLAGGKRATFTITPIKSLCQDMQGSGEPTAYLVSITYTQAGQNGIQRVADTVAPPA
ncbi:MAG TPA: zinc ribbon domain-containing protein [Ktedonobacterales bacterium]|jgi:uncharacterized cupredoxin-like copper-binding protein